MAKTMAQSFAGAGLGLDRSVWDQARLAWRLMRDERVRGFKFALPALAALYLFAPIDLIPDAIAGIGHVDDIGIIVVTMMMVMRLLPRLAPETVVAEHLRGMDISQPAGPVTSTSTDKAIEAQFVVRN